MAKFATKAVHAGTTPDVGTGAITTPIYQTSTYVQDAPGENKGFSYARGQNPSRTALETCIAALENGKFGLCFSSGMAAVDAIMRILKPGDEIITTKDLYGGSYRLFNTVIEPAGLKIKYITFDGDAELLSSISARTKLIWLETPTNPMMNIIDLKQVCSIGKSHGTLVGVDNTFATPYLQLPLDLGADIVMHSATKYLGGHSDLIMGALVLNDEKLYAKIKYVQNTCGAVPGPHDCYLTHRGIKTLHLRMKQNCENAKEIAQFLDSHKKINQVYYPGLNAHPGHDIARAQMNDFGAMLSFDLKDDRTDAAIEVMEKCKIFSVAESLGGVESLCGHPATMSHGSVPRKERLEVGIKDSMIRLSIGIEDVKDLVADLDLALK